MSPGSEGARSARSARSAELCRLLGAEHPIIEGGMAYVGNAELAAAVSKAGAFGQVGSGGLTPGELEEEIRKTLDLTDRPFGVNLPIGTHKDPSRLVDVILRAREEHGPALRAVSLSAGNPRPYIPVFKERGLAVMVVVSTVRQALKAEEAGADVLVAESFEAGGHNGSAELAGFALFPAVSRAAKVPVVAAGGIVDGRTMAAALILGASGVQVGTRFVATAECRAHGVYKDALVAARDEDTVIIERSVGRVTRVLRAPYALRVLEIEKQRPTLEELQPYTNGEKNRVAALEGRLDGGYAYCSQAGSLIDEILPAGEVVRRMATEACEVLGEAAALAPCGPPS